MKALKTNNNIFLVVNAVFIIFIVFGYTVSAIASFTALDTAAMTREADVIVIGNIKEVQPAFKGIKFTEEIRDRLVKSMGKESARIQEEEEANTIYSNVIVRVDEYLKTDPAIDTRKKEITMRLLGGTVGDITMKVPGFPYFEKDDENKPVLLFLGRSFDNVLQPFAQGTFRIKNNEAINDNFPNQNLEMPDMLNRIRDNAYGFGLSPVIKIIIAVAIAFVLIAMTISLWKYARHFK